MTSPLEKLAAHSGPLSPEPPDKKETAGLLRSGLARPADAHNEALSHDLRNLAEYEGHVDVDRRLVNDLIAACERVSDALER